VALFVADPRNFVHDGAVVIKSLRVSRAGCVLPLSANRKLDKALGTRHRAGIGITEETDAVVVVVSEERGTISFCFNGNIVSNLDGASLRQALLGLFGQRPRKKKGAPAKKPGNIQTGSYRITLPQGEPPAPARDSSIPAPSSATAGSLVVTPIQPNVDTPAPMTARAPIQPVPMPPAAPIETPTPAASSLPDIKTQPRRDPES